MNIPAQEDDFNSIRGEYVEMLKGQIAKSNNGIERYKYITFGLPAEGVAEARPRLGRVEADVMGNLKRLGVQSRPLDGRDRLAVLHGQMHPGGREPFRFAWKDIPKTGMGDKGLYRPGQLRLPAEPDFPYKLYGAPRKIARFCGERRNSETSKPCRSRRGAGCGACDDDVGRGVLFADHGVGAFG